MTKYVIYSWVNESFKPVVFRLYICLNCLFPINCAGMGKTINCTHSSILQRVVAYWYINNLVNRLASDFFIELFIA